MRIEQLWHFVVLSEELNYSNAAERLYISQPSLSKSIRSMEQELDVQLFNRGTRRVTMTEAGQILLEYARNICKDYNEAQKQIHAKMATNIVVEVMPLTFQYEIADMLAEFTRRNPDIRMRIIERENRETISRLKHNEIDLAIMRYEGKDDNLRIIPVLSNKMILAVSKEHPLATKERVSLREMQDETFLTFNKASEMYQKSKELLKANGVATALRGSELRVNTMRAFIERHHAVALLTDNMIDDNDPNIRKLPIIGDTSLSISMVLLKGKKRAELECFISFAEHYFSGKDREEAPALT